MGPFGRIAPGEDRYCGITVGDEETDLPRRDRAPACNGADVLAVIHLVHQADLPLLMMTAMDAENEIPVGGAGMGRQVLLPGGKCLPVGGAGTLAAGGVVDPVEESEDRDNHEQHQMIHHGVSLVFRDGRSDTPLVQMSHGLKMLSISKCYIHDLALVFIALPGSGTMAGASCGVNGEAGDERSQGRDSKFATYFTFYKQFLGGWTVSLIQLTLQCAGPLHLSRKRFSGDKRMLKRDMTIAGYDPELWQAITDETRRREEHIELIASRTTPAPRHGSPGLPVDQQYAEGYPAKRYYGGCEYVDVVETLAIERAKELFGATYANVQPHSGSQANSAVYMALLQPGDTVLGMNLAHGGHLTHGSPVNFSGKLYNIIPYGIGQVRQDRLRRDGAPGR